MKKSWTVNSHKILRQTTQLNHYNQWIFSLFKAYLGNNILEIGSGLGGVSQYFLAEKITLSELRDDYFVYLKNRFGDKTIKLDIEKEIPSNLKNHFDTVFSSNVFEHIANDEEAFKNCYKLLKKGGRLLIFVPAGQEIFGSVDKVMGHYRRYSKKELHTKVTNAGFKIVSLKYANFPGYFSWWLRGRFSRKPSQDAFLVNAFEHLIVPFIYLEKYLLLPFGQSLMLVAEKN